MILGLIAKKHKVFMDITPISNLIPNSYDAIIVSVAHNEFKNMGSKFISTLGKKPHVIYDLKYIFSKEETNLRL